MNNLDINNVKLVVQKGILAMNNTIIVTARDTENQQPRGQRDINETVVFMRLI